MAIATPSHILSSVTITPRIQGALAVAAGVIIHDGHARTFYVPQLQLLEELIPRLDRYKAAGKLDYQVNYLNKQEVGGRSDYLGVFSDATRPAPATVKVGASIFNTDDSAPNYSNGTGWYDAAGAAT